MEYPYHCEIEISFPSAVHAERTMKVLQVDKEVGDRVTKSLELVKDAGGSKTTLKVQFAATQAKMLRVSVSSFYDYLAVALKCYQEFDDTTLDGTAGE